MSPLFATPLPLPVEVRVIVAMAGAALGMVLAKRLRGGFSAVRSAVALALTALAIFGLEKAQMPDRLGLIAFLLGLVAGISTGMTGSRSMNSPANSSLVKWLVVVALVAGPLLGSSVAVILLWQEADSRDTAEQVFLIMLFSGIGLFAGAIAALAVTWIGWSRPGNPLPRP